MKCPKCFAENLQLFAGGPFGLYQCTNCTYVGPIALDDAPKRKKK